MSGIVSDLPWLHLQLEQNKIQLTGCKRRCIEDCSHLRQRCKGDLFAAQLPPEPSDVTQGITVGLQNLFQICLHSKTRCLVLQLQLTAMCASKLRYCNLRPGTDSHVDAWTWLCCRKAYLKLHNTDQIFGSFPTVVAFTGLTVFPLFDKEVEAFTQARAALLCNS